MKMTKKDFDDLKSRIQPLDTVERRKKYLTGEYPRAEFTRNLNKRYRWDLLFEAGGRFQQGNFMQELYSYLNDEHIDTALRAIVKEL